MAYMHDTLEQRANAMDVCVKSQPELIEGRNLENVNVRVSRWFPLLHQLTL